MKTRYLVALLSFGLIGSMALVHAQQQPAKEAFFVQDKERLIEAVYKFGDNIYKRVHALGLLFMQQEEKGQKIKAVSFYDFPGPGPLGKADALLYQINQIIPEELLALDYELCKVVNVPLRKEVFDILRAALNSFKQANITAYTDSGYFKDSVSNVITFFDEGYNFMLDRMDQYLKKQYNVDDAMLQKIKDSVNEQDKIA